MSSPLSTTWLSQRTLGKHASILLPMIVALIYAGGHLTWYLGTPLGQVPVLDEHENLALAAAIFSGGLPAEPFYRAPGYALSLAGLRWLGVSAGALFSAALCLGVILHTINAGLIARMSGRLFGERAGYAGGFIAALYPVFVHFSTQALDAIPSLTLFLFGLDRLILAYKIPPRPLDWSVASIYWGAATIMRPNFFLVWLALPLLAAWRIPSLSRSSFRCVAAALVGGLLFIGTALWQRHVAGVVGFLPWQGAYNLWAANQPDGQGRYYVQKTALPLALARQNPARIESILFYQQATGRTDTNIPGMNSYWRRRFLQEVTDQPFAWLGLVVRKMYALCNDWEQYNNKTYAFHQERSPWLRWNPFSWGVIFVLGFVGTVRLTIEAKRTALFLVVVGLTYGVSVLLFYVSDRFRLPLAALGIVLSAGALSAPCFWRPWTPRRKGILALCALAGIALTFSNFDSVRSRATFVQDHALLARAADTVGDDHLAWAEARAALAMQSHHPDALRIGVASYFNQLLSGSEIPAEESQWLEICRRFLVVPDPTDASADLRAVAALALWRAGERNSALAEWRRLFSTPAAIAARILSGDDTVPLRALEGVDAQTIAKEPLVQLAIAQRGFAMPAGLSSPQFAHPAKLAAKLFSGARPK